MNKKNLIICCVAVVIIVLLVFIFSNKKDNSNDSKIDTKAKVEYDDSTGKYTVIDENTGEVLLERETEDEINAGLEFYEDHPDYRATPPATE